MKITKLKFGILSAAMICVFAMLIGCGCETFENHTNPIEGWQIDFKSQPSQTVQKDSQDYISKLPARERIGVGPEQWFTDGKGQHALLIVVALNGTDWGHVLIYDQNDKRVKVVKYIMGHYRS